MLGSALALALLTTPPTVQEDWNSRRTPEDAIAHVVTEAMVHSGYGSLEWGSFGARAGNGVYWHLVGFPREADLPLLGVGRRRTGWVETRGAQVGIFGDANLTCALSTP